MTLTLPDAHALDQVSTDDLRLELACALHARGKISKVAGAELAGIDFFKFQEALGERGISSFTVEELHRELDSLTEIFPMPEAPLPAW